jgi:hypothetical protein
LALAGCRIIFAAARCRTKPKASMAGPFRSANRDYWDGKADFNAASWDVDAFVADPAGLTRIVAADRNRAQKHVARARIILRPSG